MNPARILIVKTGSAIAEARSRFGDFEDWFAAGLGLVPDAVSTVSVFDGQALPSNPVDAGFDGVLVTGSPAMVSHRHDWSECAAGWLAAVHEAGVPMLGVCYGHQLIAHALGGRVGTNPAGRRMGTVEIRVRAGDDPLLAPFAPTTRFQATHLEAVLVPPGGARVLAAAGHDPHHALHFGGNTWGVQFHPEFDARVMDCYIRTRADVLEAESIPVQPLLDGVRETPAGPMLLRRFAELAGARSREPRTSRQSA